ncbi:MAG: PAS domain S-box protein [Candidatus Hydrogenedentes bacterium]|nr:PAS domain S-box protein [Candidatus Hydrogenedentota bacterium]
MSRPSRSISFYLIPFLVGMCGVIFARQLPSPVRLPVVLVSVAGPLFVGGYILARVYAAGIQRFLLVSATVLLMLGAMVMVSDVSGSLAAIEEAPSRALEISRWIGTLSLLLGLVTIWFFATRTGEAIDEIGDRFRHLAQHMSEGFVLSAADGAIVLVNSRFTEMTGFSEEQLVGHVTRDLPINAELDNLLRHRDTHDRLSTLEYQVTWRLGSEDREYWVSRIPVFDRRGVYAGALATIRDITEERRLSQSLERYAQGLARLVEEQTQKLHQSEVRLRDLLVHMNEGFLAVDSSFRIRFANERICELLRISHEEIAGRDLFQFVEPTGRGRLLDLLETVETHHNAHAQQEFTLIAANNDIIPAVIALAPVPVAEGEALRYSVVITDVGKLKGMQRQLEIRAAELEAANEELRLIDRAKDGFLSNVSHELRTPMSTIRGYVEMFESQSLGPLQEHQRNALAVISRNMQRLTFLIDEMIEFSRMEIKGVQLSLTLFSVEGLLQECLGSAQPHLLAKNIRVEVNTREGLPLVWADRKKLVQVVAILLSNAIKFSPSGGLVTLTAGIRGEHELIVSVQDHGIGIDPAFHRRVFAKFFQVDSSLTRRYEGAGIGLSIAKSIVDAHAGTIELKSELNEGCNFTVALPHSVFSSELPSEYRGCMAGFRALVAADERDFREAVSTALEESGCQVTAVSKGYECVRAAREIEPHVVVLDEVLPDISGAATAHKLEEDPHTGAIHLFVLAGDASASLSPAPGSENAARYVAKPFSAADLVTEIRRVVLHEVSQDATRPSDTRTSPRPIPHVLFIDKDTDVLEWVEAALRHRQIPCMCASDPESGLQLAQHSPPDVVFLDVDLLGDNGPAMIRAICDTAQARAISIYGTTALPPGGHESNGTHGMLRKPFSVEELEAAIWSAAPQPEESAVSTVT